MEGSKDCLAILHYLFSIVAAFSFRAPSARHGVARPSAKAGNPQFNFPAQVRVITAIETAA